MLKSKTALFIFVLFLIFFPAYAVFNNAILFLFDQMFTSGAVSKIFTYNFYGEYLGCQESVKYRELYENYNGFQKHGVLIIQFLISVITYIILRKNTVNKDLNKWLLIVVFSFFLYSSLQLLFSFFYYQDFKNIEYLKLMYLSIIFRIIVTILAIDLFFRHFNRKEKIQILCIAFPASVISAYLWFGYLGPIVLPL